jgi:tetratricopeptide (TPR) repeat protein
MRMAGWTAHGTEQAKESLMRGRFVWLAGLACLGPGLVADLRAADSPPQPAAALPPYRRLLQGDNARTAEDLQERLDRDWAAGRFEAALRKAALLEALRKNAQGDNHWETVSARWQVEALRRILKQDAATRRALAGLPKIARQADEQEEADHYGTAQPLREKALALCRRALGEDHPETAQSYLSLAISLDGQEKYAEARPLYEKALAVRRKALGELHPDTAAAYHNLGFNLSSQGRYAEAQPLHEKALAVCRDVLGEQDTHTATAYGDLATNLDDQGKHTAAEPLHRKGLAIKRKLCGEEHPSTALGYSNLAGNLSEQGKHAAAQPLYGKALAIYRKVLGEGNADTASGYNNLATNLEDQGQYAAAQPLHEKALAIKRRVLGEQNPFTATGYSNLAMNLGEQGRYKDAQLLLEQALSIRRKTLGEEHPHTAASYNNLAGNLNDQGDHAAAQRLYEKALALRRKVLGEEHPATARSYNNLAYTLDTLGKYTAAEPLHRKALAIRRRALGEEHAATAESYNNLAYNLNDQGRYVEAEAYWTKCAVAFARVRRLAAGGGLERAAVTAENSPLTDLTAVLARNGKFEQAWRRFEESLARGIWDDLSARMRRSPADRDRQTALCDQLRRLDELIERASSGKAARQRKQERDDLLTRRRQKQDELDAFGAELEKKYGPVAGMIYDLAAIQRALPPDAALIGWVDVRPARHAADPNGEHWAVAVRARGGPTWVRLPGSGPGGAWTDSDGDLADRLRRGLREGSADWQALARRLGRQRWQPLVKHLAPRSWLPAVRRVIVLPAPALAGLPVEVWATGYTVSYAPSGTLLAYLRGLPQPDSRGLLAVADPVFNSPDTRAVPARLPPGGVFVTLVLPDSNAARARLDAGDVLTCYAGTELKNAADLAAQIAKHAREKDVRLTVWRDGRVTHRIVSGGELGAVVAPQPAPAAVAEHRRGEQRVARGWTGDDEHWPGLPGTRVEAERLGRLCRRAAVPWRLLADSQASEQELDRLARSKALSHYRYVHLATHGALDDRLPLESAVILARDRLPDPLKQLQAGKPVYTGRLTAREVLERWELHADLVTLSACQTALGKYEDGEGFVGFTQALLLAGARSVCVSLWKVDDTATALLMQRFYANLLGQREGLTKPLGKAEALAEAKAWLRDLSAEEAARQAAALTQGVARGKGRKPLPLLPAAKVQGTGKAARPYAHPYYWAAFVLVGDAG